MKYVVRRKVNGWFFGWSENWSTDWVEDLEHAHLLSKEEAEEEASGFVANGSQEDAIIVLRTLADQIEAQLPAPKPAVMQ